MLNFENDMHTLIKKKIQTVRLVRDLVDKVVAVTEQLS